MLSFPSNPLIYLSFLYILQDFDGHEKKISSRLFDRASFERYCNGEIGTQTRTEELAVYDIQEEKERVNEVRRQRAEGRAEREARITRGGENESDYEEDQESEDDYDYY